MNFLIRHLWVVAVAAVAVNHLLSAKRVRAATRDDPVAQAKAGRLLIGMTLFQLIPWIILGIGILSGSIESVFVAFSPRPDNAYVASVWIFAIVGSALVAIWILFAGGATFVSKYGVGLSPQPIPIRQVRLLGVVLVVMAIAMGWWMLYMGPAPVPKGS